MSLTQQTEKFVHMDALDYARFFAAMSVVFFHYIVIGPDLGAITSYEMSGLVYSAASLGYLGVDLFFIVSGFVIALSAKAATPATFVRSRFVRLWPTFMLCMTITALVRILSGRTGMAVTAQQYIANWTMVSHYFGQPYIDGVYWTLVYELAFYILMLLLITARQVHRLELICKIWLVLIVALSFTSITILGFTGYFALFCSGCMFFIVWQKGWNLSRILFLCLATIFCSFEAASRFEGQIWTQEKYWVAGIIVSIFLFFGLLVSTPLGSLRLPFARTLGLMTYPLYLIHAYVGYVLLSTIAVESNKWAMIWAVIILMLIASYSVVYGFERPMNSWLRAKRKLKISSQVDGR